MFVAGTGIELLSGKQLRPNTNLQITGVSAGTGLTGGTAGPLHLTLLVTVLQQTQ